MQILVEKIIISLFSGFLFTLPTLLFSKVPLSIMVALVGWIIISIHPRYKKNFYSTLFIQFMGFYLFWVISYRTIAVSGKWIPFAFGFSGAFWYTLFPLILRSLRGLKKSLFIIAIPAAWVTTEFFVDLYDFPDATLYLSGYYLIMFRYIVQVCDIFGIYALNFFVGLINTYIVLLIMSIIETRTINPLRLARGLKFETFFLLICLVSSFIYGIWRLNNLELSKGIRISLIQPNSVHDINKPERNYLKHVILTNEEVKTGESDLVIWPENAIMEYFMRDGKYIMDIQFLARKKKAAILVGAYGNNEWNFTNSCYLVSREGFITGQYDKIHLLPYSEYVPFDRFIYQLNPYLWAKHRQATRNALRYLPNGASGDEPKVFQLQGKDMTTRFSPVICAESLKMDDVRESVLRGAQFLVNITSESRVGKESQQQMFFICILRSMENRVSFIRVGNNGISCFIDPAGKIQSIVRGFNTGKYVDDEGVLTNQVILSNNTPTFYTRHGPWFAIICIIIILIFVLYFLVSEHRYGRLKQLVTTWLKITVVVVFCIGIILTGCKYLPGWLQSINQPDQLNPDTLELMLSMPVKPENADKIIYWLKPYVLKKPGAEKAYSQLAEGFVKTGRLEEGYLLFKHLYEVNPSSMKALFYLANFQDLILYYPEALSSLKKIIQQDPCNIKAIEKYVDLLYGFSFFKECLEFKDIPCEDKDSLFITIFVGRAYAALGMSEKALEYLEKAYRNNPRDLLAIIYLGRFHTKLGNYDKAIEIFSQAYQMYPKEDGIFYELARVKWYNGEYKNLNILRPFIK